MSQTSETSVVETVREDIVHPFFPNLKMLYEVELEEMLINKVANTTLSRISRKIEEESYLIVGRIKQVLYPKPKDSSPFTLRIYLGEHAHYFDKEAYSLADWMIDMGGISRSCFIGGMVIAHFVASHMQQA